MKSTLTVTHSHQDLLKQKHLKKTLEDIPSAVFVTEYEDNKSEFKRLIRSSNKGKRNSIILIAEKNVSNT